MERKNFLTAAVGAAAALIGSGALVKAAPLPPQPGPISTPLPPGPVPRPSGTPPETWRRDEYKSGRNLQKVRHRLERVIDELQHDQNDYGGHRAQAMTLLQQAREQLLEAEQYDTAHPNTTATARPF